MTDNFAQALKEARAATEMSQQGMAERMLIPTRTIEKWETVLKDPSEIPVFDVGDRPTMEQADAIIARIVPGLKENLCKDCDLIVEAAFENMEVKKTTFKELDELCKPGCVFASNTSSLSSSKSKMSLSDKSFTFIN